MTKPAPSQTRDIPWGLMTFGITFVLGAGAFGLTLAIQNKNTPVEEPAPISKPLTVEQAAQQGEPTAEYALGQSYYYGTGVSQDYAKAMYWFRKAGELQYRGGQTLPPFPKATFAVAVMFEKGQGVPKNDDMAFEWYLSAAEAGYAPAQYNVGVMYANGQGTPAVESKASYWLHKAAEQGNTDAQTAIQASTGGNDSSGDYAQRYVVGITSRLNGGPGCDHFATLMTNAANQTSIPEAVRVAEIDRYLNAADRIHCVE